MARQQLCLGKFRFTFRPSVHTSPFFEQACFYSRQSQIPCTRKWVLYSENAANSPESRVLAALVTMLAGAIAGFGLLHTNAAEPVARCDTSELQKPGMVSSAGSKFWLTEAYRRRVFFKYERRLRMLSPPEKVFDYFASIKTSGGQSFMTASDLMRAVVPVFPPSESTLVREGSLPGERSPGELRCPPSKFFMLFDTNGDGLISFSEYMFFLTLLSIPEINFRTAVRMFDLDGNGTIDREEFTKVMEVMRSRIRRRPLRRDGLRTVSKVENVVQNEGLVEFLFREDGKKLLKHEDFELFLKELHEEIIRLEFAHYDYWDHGSISAKDFGLSLVAAANLSHINYYLDCVNALGNEASFKDCRVSFEEFHNFAELRKQLRPLALAISSYGETYGLLTKSDFQRAASQVCKVPITNNVIDIVYFIFDINQDGNLSTEEFLGVLERREHGMSEGLDSGIMPFLKCCWQCASNCHYQSRWIYF